MIINALKWTEDIKEQVVQIFFESSTKKVFKNPIEKKLFQYKYLDYYLNESLSNCYAFLESEGSGKVLGYVLVSEITEDKTLIQLHPYYEHFSAHLKLYPAHLHINCHAEARGQGVGSQLIEEVCQSLRSKGISGVHVITTSDAPNTSFYHKNAFELKKVHKINEIELVLMGRLLDLIPDQN